MFIPGMLPLLAPAELAAVVVNVVLFALAQPAISATVAAASTPRRIFLRTFTIWSFSWAAARVDDGTQATARDLKGGTGVDRRPSGVC